MHLLTVQTAWTRQYWMIYRWPCFLAVVWFGSFPPPLPLARCLSFLFFLCVASRAYRRGGGPNRKRRESLVLYKSSNTLWAWNESSYQLCLVNHRNLHEFFKRGSNRLQGILIERIFQGKEVERRQRQRSSWILRQGTGCWGSGCTVNWRSGVTTREYWMMYRGFLAVGWFAPPPFQLASWLSFSDFLCVAGRAYWMEKGEGEGMGEEPNHTTARKPGPI